MLASTVTTMQDNSAHGEDSFLSKDLGGGEFLDVVLDGVTGHGIEIVSAGDSPVFLINNDGHRKLSGNAGGFLHVGVARAIGASETLGAPAQVKITPAPGDRIFLATDGITDNMTIEELAEVIRDASTPEDASAQIEQTIKDRLQDGRVPETIGVRFRYDDRTGIIRFF